MRFDRWMKTQARRRLRSPHTLRTKIFGLVNELNRFKGMDLDVHRKIANLGEKTFRWENGSESHEVKFNYTLNSPAAQLLQICEGLARQQELIELLQRRIKYDRLGVNDALLQLENDVNKGVLPEPLHEVVNVGEVDLVQQRRVAPRRHRLAKEELVGFEPELAHPGRLVLHRADPLDDLAASGPYRT